MTALPRAGERCKLKRHLWPVKCPLCVSKGMCQSKVGKGNALDKLCKSDLNLSFGPRSAGHLKCGLKIHSQQGTLIIQTHKPRSKINMLMIY